MTGGQAPWSVAKTHDCVNLASLMAAASITIKIRKWLRTTGEKPSPVSFVEARLGQPVLPYARLRRSVASHAAQQHHLLRADHQTGWRCRVSPEPERKQGSNNSRGLTVKQIQLQGHPACRFMFCSLVLCDIGYIWMPSTARYGVQYY